MSITIGLQGDKNDQYGRGAWRTMHRSSDRLLCPVEALKHIRVTRATLGKVDEEILCAGVTSDQVTHALKKVARQAGIPASAYSTHSIRINGATALLNGAADGLANKLLGRWMSNCFEAYPVQAASVTVDLASTIVVKHHRASPKAREPIQHLLGSLTMHTSSPAVAQSKRAPLAPTFISRSSRGWKDLCQNRRRHIADISLT